jgi:hypothetical protein
MDLIPWTKNYLKHFHPHHYDALETYLPFPLLACTMKYIDWPYDTTKESVQLHLVAATESPPVWKDSYKFGDMIALTGRTNFEACGHYFCDHDRLIPAKIYMDQQTASCPCVPFVITEKMTNACAKYETLLRSEEIRGYRLRFDDEQVKSKLGRLPPQFSFLRVGNSLYVRFDLQPQDAKETVSAAQRKSWYQFDWQTLSKREIWNFYKSCRFPRLVLRLDIESSHVCLCDVPGIKYFCLRMELHYPFPKTWQMMRRGSTGGHGSGSQRCETGTTYYVCYPEYDHAKVEEHLNKHAHYVSYYESYFPTPQSDLECRITVKKKTLSFQESDFHRTWDF